VNFRPAMLSAPPQTVTAGVPWSYALGASDPNGDNVVLSLLRSPAGATLSSAGTLSWLAPASLAGSVVSFAVLADDQRGLQETQAFEILVLASPNPAFSWSSLPSVPGVVGEVSAAVIDNRLFLLGDGTSRTMIFDLSIMAWAFMPPRPHAGNHHGAEWFEDTLYVIGGLGQGSPSRLQMLNITSATWELGSLPWSTGSAATARIGRDIYVCGGVQGTSTISACGECGEGCEGQGGSEGVCCACVCVCL
jgi:hypothetical protein